MKQAIWLLAAALLTISARPLPHRYTTKQLTKQETKLNSASRPGGVTRSLITVQVPAATEYLYYSVAASPKGALEDLGLHAQISKHVHEEGFNAGIGTAILGQLLVPKGDGVAEVFVITDAKAAANFENKVDNGWTYNDEFSRKNISSGTVGIPITFSLLPQTLYLGIRNPSTFNAQFVSVEVAAVVRQL